MPAFRKLTNRTALVTGGTGTVGRVLVKRLLGDGWHVRVLTRKAEGAGTDGAMYVLGDLEKRRALGEAVRDCDLVVHCAITKSGVDVEAAGDLADASSAAGVRRFVHVSTISVYPVVPAGSAGSIDESCGYVSADSNDAYALMKSRIEHTLLARADRLHLGIIQPANIVSPTGGWWTSGVVELMRKGRFILVNGGTGTANLVGVEDVAASAALAAVADYASGSRFLIADGHPRPWRGYLEHLETMAGVDALEDMTVEEAKRYSRAAVDASLAARVSRRIARAVTGARPVWPMDDAAIDRFASRAVVSIEHARRTLGYSPSETRWPSSVPERAMSIRAAPPPKMP